MHKSQSRLSGLGVAVMPVEPRRSTGITMLDGAALVTGGAVASVHFREFTGYLPRMGASGWVILTIAFVCLAITSAGPFVFFVRRVGRRPPGYPTLPDLLWLAFGIPWLFAALYRSAQGNAFNPRIPGYSTAVFIGLTVASAGAIYYIKRTWKSLDQALFPDSPPISWTERVGKAIVATWPMQFGLAVAMTG